MTSIAVSGACGRMGRRIIALAQDARDVRVGAALEAPEHPLMGQDSGRIAGRDAIRVPVTAELGAPVDVFLDFSTPQATLGRLGTCLKWKIPMVIGTTGFTADQQQQLKDAATAIALLVSPNMSSGVNLLFELVATAAGALGSEFDVEIVEAHHRLKKDAPSGTALKLAQAIAQARQQDAEKAMVFGRKGLVGERQEGAIGLHAVRGGDIVGDHTVVFAGPAERIEITHRAHSRDAFALGALRAARFLAGKKPGWYDMKDVLGSS